MKNKSQNAMTVNNIFSLSHSLRFVWILFMTWDVHKICKLFLFVLPLKWKALQKSLLNNAGNFIGKGINLIIEKYEFFFLSEIVDKMEINFLFLLSRDKEKAFGLHIPRYRNVMERFHGPGHKL